MIVVDSGLLAYLVLPGDRTEEAEAVFAKDSAWAIPAAGMGELRALVAQLVRRDEITVDEGVAVLEQASALISGRDSATGVREVLELSRRSRSSARDCEHIVLAISLGVQLVTYDSALLGAFPKHAVSPAAFVG